MFLILDLDAMRREGTWAFERRISISAKPLKITILSGFYARSIQKILCLRTDEMSLVKKLAW